MALEECRDNKNASREIVARQSLASLADNFSAPYIGYYLASLTSSGLLQGILQFSVNSLPTTAQILLGPFLDKMGRYVLTLLITSITASLLWIVISLTTDPLHIVAIYTLRAVIVGLAGLSLTSFIGVFFIDARLRSRVLSLVTLASQLTALIAFLIMGLLPISSVDILRTMFIISGLISLGASIIWFRLLKLDKCIAGSSGTRRQSFFGSIKTILKNKSFMKFDISFSAYILVMSIAWPYFPMAQRNLYKMTVAELAILNILGTLSTMISQYILMRVIDRVSLKKIIIIGRAGFIIPPLFYAVSPNIELIYISNILTGPFSAIGNVAITLYVYETSIKGLQASHLAFLNFSQGITAAIGSLTGGVLMDWLLRSYGVDGLRIGFAISTVLRGLLTIPFLKIDDVRIKP
ncbi:MAG: MFS transporter [Sulfolobales archaeon]